MEKSYVKILQNIYIFVPQMGQTGLVPFGRILVHDMIIPVDWMKGFVIRAAIQESVI